MTAVLGLGLAACTQSSDSRPEREAPSPSSATSVPPSASADEQEGTPIRIRIGDQTLDATVWDNATGRALLEQLPLTLSFKDLNGEEKVGHVDHQLTMNGMPDGDDPQVGDLGYYAPWGNVVLYYGDVGRWDGIARIGRIHGNMSVISDQNSDFTATLETAK
ncbi:cyclophilin-like fold protein [Streptomyces sp. NPDC047046]|uniref:cyclophilin-like fold protein n=1 Tax=Streptomyces sp. NPDC047046 TaxID=3155378 RepID=UPI0033DD6968